MIGRGEVDHEARRLFLARCAKPARISHASRSADS